MAEGWPTEHTEEFLIGGNGVNGGRRAVPNPRAGKPVPRGMGFPAHVGAEGGGWRRIGPRNTRNTRKDF